MKKIVIVIVLIVIVSGVFFILKGTEKPIGETETTPPPIIDTRPLADRIEIDDNQYVTNGNNSNIKIVRPTFKNLSDQSAQALINSKINDAIAPYIKEIDIVSEGLTDQDTENSDFTVKQYNYNVNYERYNSNPYISLIINQDYDTEGMRSNQWRDMFTVDVETCKIITLKDLCDIDVFANFKQNIVDEINAQANAGHIALMGGRGLNSISDEQKFYIKDGKLYIYFEAGLIAQYTAGELVFEMPYRLENKHFVR